MGVSDEDRIKDYEVTSFLKDDFYRSSADKYAFIQKNISGLYKADTYQQSIEKYLLEFVELTQDEIDSLKDILTGKVEVAQGSIAYQN